MGAPVGPQKDHNIEGLRPECTEGQRSMIYPRSFEAVLMTYLLKE